MSSKKHRIDTKMDIYDLTLNGKLPFQARTPRQEAALQALKFNDMVILSGPAGTGKTFIPSCVAAEKLVFKEVEQIVITRPTVPIDGEEIGFLPGGIRQKVGPWVEPMLDAMKERIGRDKVELLIKEGRINIIPFAFMRGRTFKNAFVIADEFQNTTLAQAKALVTRIGEGSKYAICGDPDQSDIEGTNGLASLVGMIDRHDLPVPIIQFTSKDVVRSKLCQQWVQAFEKDRTPALGLVSRIS